MAGLLALLAHPKIASAVAANLAPAERFGGVSLMLSLVTAQRKHSSAVYATSERLVDSFWEGGLDHLWSQRNTLDLPPDFVGKWGRIAPYPNPDARVAPGQRAADVHPALIPARDQLLIYAAQLNASFVRFQQRVSSLNDGTCPAATVMSRVGRIVWQAFCFLAPGGRDFDGGRPISSQISQHLGSQTVLQYLVKSSKANPVDLDRVFQDEELNRSAWIKSAKVRATECLFLERLLTTVRDLGLARS